MRPAPKASRGRSALALAAVAAGASCGNQFGPGRGFDVNFQDNREQDVSAVMTAVAQRPGAEPPALALLTAIPPARGFRVVSLPDGRALWSSTELVDVRPFVLGDLVISHAASQVVAWDARTGRERWHLHDRGYSLLGAGSDGDAAALTLGPGGLDHRNGVFLLLDAGSGGVRMEKEVEQALGSPAVAGGYAFVPWNSQHLSVVDTRSGAERARIRSGDDSFGRAMAEGGAVYFGAQRLYRFAPAAASGSAAQSPTLGPPRDDLPGGPPFLPDGYSPARVGLNARERVAVVLRPDPAAADVNTLDGVVYAVFHRAIFAVDARGRAVRWGALRPADIIGAQPVHGGVLVVDERGEAATLDVRAGNVTWHQSLGPPAAQAVLQVPIAFAPPASGAEPAQPATTSLLSVASDTDDRLLPARLFAARALALVPGPEATRGLLDLAARRNSPAELRAAAAESLSARTDGLEVLLDALGTHYDYVRQTGAPPVGPIARALARAGEHRAIPPLLSHLHDPETPTADLPAIVTALRDLGDAAAVPGLLDFVRTYHSDEGAAAPPGSDTPVNDRTGPEQAAINQAIDVAVGALARLGGAEERRWLQSFATDHNTVAAVRASTQHALEPPAAGGGDPSAAGGDGGAGAAPGGDQLPPRLSQAMIDEAFEPLREQMLRCFRTAPSRPSQLRILFRYDATGAVTNVTVTPTEWAACIAPIASTVTLPFSTAAREVGSYYVVGGVR